MPCPRTQQANLLACSPQTPLNAERQAGKLRMPFFKSFDMTRQGNEPLVYRLQSGRSSHYAIASVACYPSAVVQGAARWKNGLCEGSARGNCDPWEGQQPFRPNPNGVGNRITTLMRLLIGTVQFCSLYIYILYIRQKFRTSLSKKIRVNTCFVNGQKVRNDD